MNALEKILTDSYEEMGTGDLRRLVRERGLGKGAIVANARKDELIQLLKGEIPCLIENDPAKIDVPDFVPEPRVVVPPMPEPPKVSDSELADVLAAALSGKIKSGLDEDRVIELIRDPLNHVEIGVNEQQVIALVKEHAKIEKVVKRIVVKGAPAVEMEDHTHHCFERVLKLVGLGLPVLLVGPAGTGKTTLAGQIAKALGKRFSFNSMSAGCSESHLIGRTLPDADGNWTYKPSPFVTTYQKGGVHLFDEIDAADPNLMVVINAALANGHLSIPFEDMIIERHEDTTIIAAANTFGTGANRQYVGRNALDAATIDRFSVSTIEVGYDEDLEKKLVYQFLGEDRATELLDGLWGIRKKIEAAGLRRIMSTRTLVNAAKRMATGDTLASIKKDYFSGWSKDELNRVK